MNDVILLTGATGFLGSWVAARLIQRPNCTLLALVRAESHEAAERRLSRAWWDWPELVKAIGWHAIGERVKVICGDVCMPQLGLNGADYAALAQRVTHIIHTAADLRINAPIGELRRTNVQGVEHMLALARAAQQHHGLKRLAHVSTAYVAGGRSGVVPEDALTDQYGFASTYELSKYEGERLVQAAKSELPISVFRPGMIVGDSRTGAIKTFNTFYFPLRLYLSGKARIFPASRHLPVNIVPVDYVAEAIARLTFAPEAEGLNFHLTAPREALPTAGEVGDFVHRWAEEHLGKFHKPWFIPIPVRRDRYHAARLAPHEGGRRDSILAYLPYFGEQRQFQRDNVDRLLGPYIMQWRDLLPRLLEYAVYMTFLHKSERTAHEQILFRLESQSRPVLYHDLAQGQTIIRTGREVRQEMLAAAAALREMGIQPGDRVGIVGLNSSRYLTLDVAIGLAGAVSVPMYYTSPPVEMDAILNASGARLLFIGAPKPLERLGEFGAHLPVVSFGYAPLSSNLARPVMRWEEFLALGAGKPQPAMAPVSFSAPATLCYTSGTTGQPKGALFTHANLRWMGESLASLFPWKSRFKLASYLSFLPMNHVVEGILATYSPYYVPAPLDIYFLEDFREIQRALPRVRPTVFFSVPRLYEKVWEGFAQNRIGAFYLRLKDGALKRLLRPLLRWQILHKAGLDRCTQLIAGSAPSSEALLANFRALGIEVHNAYGMSEAPLITLNRLGRNQLGTVGEPLPQTEIRIAEDGEVLVRGPQVMKGYFEPGIPQPFQDGWLLTGDLGSLTPEGSLILQGRKKEMMATAYGKKIYPAKIEALLREIPGVAEAMLIGDSRPYCTALLWVGEDYRAELAMETIDRGVAAANTRLSHPEQAKRWAILPNDLSIERGDLTANLKLKRQAAMQRFAAVITMLYDGGSTLEGALHIGAVRQE